MVYDENHDPEKHIAGGDPRYLDLRHQFGRCAPNYYQLSRLMPVIKQSALLFTL